ncbi:MAG: RsmG family class I SAM-dependent methyltransferase [Acidimicrobiia bacterium]
MTGLDALEGVFEDARRLGFLGPDPVRRHIDHARAWAGALAPAPFLDLGSGAGVPGLVFALLWPDVRATLLDGQIKRTAWLRTAVVRLGLTDRVTVLEGRAEDLAHDPAWRERFALIAARSFAAPAPTAECASGLLAVGGRLTVSEPPQSGPERWSVEGLERLSMEMSREVVHEHGSFVILTKGSALAEEFPRRRNLSVRSPLW